jgi:hypothetical protein
VTRAEEQRAIEEALDRLLEPLAEDERPPPPMPEIVPLNRSGPSLRDLAVRLRWSRIPRLVASWTVGLAAFWAAIWIIVR